MGLRRYRLQNPRGNEKRVLFRLVSTIPCSDLFLCILNTIISTTSKEFKSKKRDLEKLFNDSLHFARDELPFCTRTTLCQE